MKIQSLLSTATISACLALASTVRANPITWTFLEHGHNVLLGNSSVFTESGFSLKAYGYSKVPYRPSPLFAKFTSGDPGETGLGMRSDLGGEHEIDNNHFVQIDSVITPAGARVGSIGIGSVQLKEDAGIYGSNVLGVLGTWLATTSVDGSVDLASWVGHYRYFGVTDTGKAKKGNVLITSLTAYRTPDGGATALLLGFALLGLGMAARGRAAR